MQFNTFKQHKLLKRLFMVFSSSLRLRLKSFDFILTDMT